MRPSRLKELAAIAGERLGRLKLNGHVVSRSPLSRLMELDFLALGLVASRQLWENVGADERLAGIDELQTKVDALRADARAAL